MVKRASGLKDSFGGMAPPSLPVPSLGENEMLLVHGRGRVVGRDGFNVIETGSDPDCQY